MLKPLAIPTAAAFAVAVARLFILLVSVTAAVLCFGNLGFLIVVIAFLLWQFICRLKIIFKKTAHLFNRWGYILIPIIHADMRSAFDQEQLLGLFCFLDGHFAEISGVCLTACDHEQWMRGNHIHAIV